METFSALLALCAGLSLQNYVESPAIIVIPEL